MARADTDEEGPISPTPTFAGWKPGDIIDGRLQIQELIGKGGMGVVWRVHHREWNRELAVKMPLPALVDSPTARERFLREAETWIDLGVHPHIVQCWFVMEISGLPSLFLDYLTGGSLKQWIDEGLVRPGQWQRILEIGIQVCEGMAYAHSRGVIHRDIKPANLLIRGDDTVCVTDFGIVKTATSVDAPVSFEPGQLPKDFSITGTGAFLGTPQYGAPEQWGTAGEVDVAADIYALGVTIYEMCCGRRPFDADAERLAPEVLIDRHLTAAAPDPRVFYAGVPPDLAELVLRCLAKEPHRRPPTMARLQQELEAIYLRLLSRPYQGVGRVPSEQQPDTLNNRAVSLYSLNKRDEARDVWRRGLRIESGHPECLYNLTQVDKRAGKIDAEEALRRLRQARVGLPLALLCVEEGRAQEAVDILKGIKESDTVNNGPSQRALGDALMYTQQYYAAEKAYRSALNSMPADVASQERKRLANLGKRSLAGKFYFPSASPAFQIITSDLIARPLLLHDSSGVIGANETHICLWNIEEECLVAKVPRVPTASPPKQVWNVESLLLLEDQDSFELRRLPDLTLLGRKTGQIIAVTRTLHRMVVADRDGVFLFDVRQSALKRLDFGPGITGEGRLVVCFDQSGDQLCLLLPTGQIAQPDENHQICPESWPSCVNDAGDATCMMLSHNGSVLYIGHASGRLQALHFGKQRIEFDLRLPFPIQKLELCRLSRHLVVTLESGFVIVNRHGQVLLQGDGPVEIDWHGNRCLVFHQGHLELYELRPFRKLREWTHQVVSPRFLMLGQDGRRAVSLDSSGTVDVWEVDEDHRVFERFFLLSPGRSYAEIVSASQRFRNSLVQAQEALERADVSVAYRHLNRARSVDGYAQAPEALNLHWELLSTLRRGRLEAVWERLSLSSDNPGERPGPIALSEDGHHLLVSFGPKVTLFLDTGSETKDLWSFQCKEVVLAVSLLTLESSEKVAFIIDRQGNGGHYDLKNGSLTKAVSWQRGPIRQVAVHEHRAYFSTESGTLGLFDLNLGTMEVEVQVPEGVERFFPLSHDSVVVSDQESYGILCLTKKKIRITPIQLKGVNCVAPLSFARYDQGESLLHLGFADGTLVICDANRHRPVFQLAQATGAAITGFELVANLSVGLATTADGHLLFFDLHSGELLEEFSAHRGAIQQLCLSESGRYLATAASGGHVRLWETSWTACEDEQEPILEWLPTPTALTKISQFLGLGGKTK